MNTTDIAHKTTAYRVSIVRLDSAPRGTREEVEFDAPIHAPASAYDAATAFVQAGDRLWIDAEPVVHNTTARYLVAEALRRRGLLLDLMPRVPMSSYRVTALPETAVTEGEKR